jgi:pyruvate/2-oxoacid:ferredoxin oxidoreductase beta subunit
VNDPPKTRPVREYLEKQGRHSALDESSVQQLQREVDEGWARLLQRAGGGSPVSVG